MRSYATINSYTFSTSSQYVDLTSGGKVFIYVTGQDVRFSLDQQGVDGENWFPILDGQTLVLDFPIGIDAPVWFRAEDTGGAAVTLKTLVTANPLSSPLPVMVVE